MILGMVILIIGVCIAFGSKRTIWAIRKNIDDINNNTSVILNSFQDLNKNSQIIFLMGQSDRDKAAFEREFKDLRNNLS
jgi:hypothetical protein